MVGPFGFVWFLPSPVLVRVLWPSAWFPSPCSYPVHQLVAWLPATALAPLSSSLSGPSAGRLVTSNLVGPSVLVLGPVVLVLAGPSAGRLVTSNCNGTLDHVPRSRLPVIATPDGTLDHDPDPDYHGRWHLPTLSPSLSGPSAGRLFTSNRIGPSVLVLGPAVLVLVRSISRSPGYQHQHWHPPCPCPWFRPPPSCHILLERHPRLAWKPSV